MKLGFLSDAHGNAAGLEYCLGALQRFAPERIYFLGDAVGYMPHEKRVLEQLREASVICQKGNHEAMLLGELSYPSAKESLYRIQAAKQRLSSGDLDFIAGWPEHREIQIGERKALLVHGAPDNYLQGYIYPDQDHSMLDALPYDALFMGNTHHPFVEQRPRKLLVNVGSCGLPRDQGDLLSFALYDSVTHRCQIFRISFDVDRIVADLREAGIAEEVCECFYRKKDDAYGERLGRAI